MKLYQDVDYLGGDFMAMIKYIILRFIWMAIGLFLIMSLVFITTRAAHVNVWFVHMNFPDDLWFVLNDYRQFVINVFTKWDWGVVDGKPVWDTLLETAPITLKLNLIAFVFYFPVGLIIGSLTALKAHSIFDKVVSGILLVLGSIPNFIWIFLFIIFFGYTIAILPPQPPSIQAPLYWRIAGWVMPVAALSLAPIAKFSGMMRSELIENFDADYLLLLRTKGLSRKQAMTRHVIRDSIIPIMPEIAPTFVFVIVGSFFVEMIYNMSGVATLLFRSMFRPGGGFYYIAINTPMTVMICTFYATITLFFIFLMDILYAIVDPRIRIGKKK